MYDLVERALEECGVDGDEGVESVRGHSGGHADGVLLRDADVEDSVRELASYVHETCAFKHCRADADDGLVLAHDARYCLCKHLRVGGRSGRISERRAWLMELDRVVLGRFVASALMGQQVYQGDRTGGFHGLSERLFQLFEVMAVNGSKVLESHLRPKHGGHHETLYPGIEPLSEPVHQLARGHLPGECLHAIDHRLIFGMGYETLAPIGEEADVLGD